MTRKFIVVFLSIVFSLYADIIILNNGQRYEGKVINQTREKVQIRLENGKEIIINKSEIQKIQFGLTEEERRRIEEEKRRLEEAKKQEEERRRIEEEKRRLEEAKKQEEERKKLEEEKRKALQKKEPLLKRKELYLGLGTGISNSYLPLESLENLFNNGALVFSTLAEANRNFSFVGGIHHTISNTQGEVLYNQNNWSLGFKFLDFDLKQPTKDIKYYSIYSGISPPPFPPNFYFNYEVSLKPKIDENNSYKINNFYGKYYFYKYNLGNSISYVSIPFGIMNHNIHFKTESWNLEGSLINPSIPIRIPIYQTKDISSNNTNALYSGITAENQFSNDLRWNINLLMYYGKFGYTNNIRTIRENGGLLNAIVNYSGLQRGIEFTNRIERNINPQTSMFLEITHFEIRFSIGSVVIDGFTKDPNGFQLLNFFTPFFSNIFRFIGLTSFKEINRRISFGVIYKIGL